MTAPKASPAGLQQLRQAVAYGLLNFGHAVEADWKADAVVAGGHRSFHEGEPPVGGNMRRSIHTAAYLDGRQIAGGSDENGDQTPDYGTSGITVIVGSNCGYGLYVDQGTSKMPARPAAVPALMKNRANAAALIAAGARRHQGGS